ncbi:hypothetical protein [Yunchengibacter salinarum]|uniref:hypothetical protein n=1 Tax=Yunchengibacter salinarum TaxID=3133399 RepID=UPI0035B67B27
MTYNNGILVILVAPTLMAIGFLRVFLINEEIQSRLKFAQQYRENFLNYCGSFGKDNKTYNYIILHLNKMQLELGSAGIISKFKPPGANYIVSNVPVISHLIPEIRRLIDENDQSGIGVFNRIIVDYMKTVDEIILSHIGTLETKDDTYKKMKRNPLIWLREGSGVIISFPFYVSSIFGIFGKTFLDLLKGNIVFNLINLIAVIISIASGLMTLLLGWKRTLELITSFIG